MRVINIAVGKIGTGTGNEKRLHHGGGYSIRASKGGRIIFEYNESHSEAVLTDYTPDHKYKWQH